MIFWWFPAPWQSASVQCLWCPSEGTVSMPGLWHLPTWRWRNHCCHLSSVCINWGWWGRQFGSTWFLYTCKLWCNKIPVASWLAWWCSCRGLDPKIWAVEKFLMLTTWRLVQGVGQLTSYYWWFIPNFSKLAWPPSSLTCHKVPFKWSASCHKHLNSWRTLAMTPDSL